MGMDYDNTKARTLLWWTNTQCMQCVLHLSEIILLLGGFVFVRRECTTLSQTDLYWWHQNQYNKGILNTVFLVNNPSLDIHGITTRKFYSKYMYLGVTVAKTPALVIAFPHATLWHKNFIFLQCTFTLGAICFKIVLVTQCQEVHCHRRFPSQR